MPKHPLDPLNRDELEQATTILKKEDLLGNGTRLMLLELEEPSKDSVAAYEADPSSQGMERNAVAILRDPNARATHEVRLSLNEHEVLGTVERRDIQPALTIAEAVECKECVIANADYRAALARRGLDDTSLLTVEVWGVGDLHRDEHDGRRLAWCPSWTRRKPGDNPYARPIEGLYAVVDLDEMQVIELEDHGAIPVPEQDGNYTPDSVGKLRSIAPLDIVQEQGPGFVVEGRNVTWENWSLRLGFTPREGLVLHQVAYSDGDQSRSILYRASFSELYVPYGDPSAGSYRRNGFDMGEVGIGLLTNSLELGCDCLGEIAYFDATLADNEGQPYDIPNAICLHEEDSGLLWKHTDTETGQVEVRRARRLVVSSIATADNYEYGFYWYLYQDGSIECEVKLTGIVLTAGVDTGDTPRFGRLVAPGVSAPNHQHFFSVRLDFDIDGSDNSVSQVHAEPAGADENPYGNAFQRKVTPLSSEADAAALVDSSSGRYWRIENPGVLNAFEEPVAYKLVPGATSGAMSMPDASARRRARFVEKNVCVTPFRPEERYASGQYPYQSTEDEGLARWIEQDRSIENRDIVLWYTFASTHLPRPEDWPVMPVERIGFSLKPDGFFNQNPALDVPPPQAAHECDTC